MRKAVEAIIHYFSLSNKTQEIEAEEDLLLKFEEADKGLSSTDLVQKYNFRVVKHSPSAILFKDKFNRDSISSVQEVARIKHHPILKNKLPSLPLNEEIYENEAVSNDN